METGEPNSLPPCHAVARIIHDRDRTEKKPGFLCHLRSTALNSSGNQPSEAGLLALARLNNSLALSQGSNSEKTS
jgi:hypothetical protein